MRVLAILLLAPLVLLAQPPDQGGKKIKKPITKSTVPDKAKAELKWAKGIVEDFFTTGSGPEYKQAVTLMSGELKKTVNPEDLVYNRLYEKAGTWTFSSEELSPDGMEAVFRGTVLGKKGSYENHDATFVARVLKDKDSGAWRIHLFAMTDWKKKEAGAKEEPQK